MEREISNTKVNIPVKKPERREVPLMPEVPTRIPIKVPVPANPVKEPEKVPVPSR